METSVTFSEEEQPMRREVRSTSSNVSIRYRRISGTSTTNKPFIRQLSKQSCDGSSSVFQVASPRIQVGSPPSLCSPSFNETKDLDEPSLPIHGKLEIQSSSERSHPLAKKMPSQKSTTSSSGITGLHYRRTSSTITNDIPYKNQLSKFSSQTSISRSEYHQSLKEDFPKGVSTINRNLIGATLAVVFSSSFIFGYNIGVLNVPVNHIKAFYNETYTRRRDGVAPSITELTFLWSLTTALFIPGGMVGSYLGGNLADKFGRKKTIIFSQIFLIVGALLSFCCVWAGAPEMLMLGRIFVGIHSGLGTCLAPMFLSEICAIDCRGSVSTSHQLSITIGIFVSSLLGIPSLLGTAGGWNFLFLLELIPAAASLILCFIPDTPRYILIVKKDRDAATAALQFYRRSSDVYAELEEMDTEDKQKTMKNKGDEEVMQPMQPTDNKRVETIVETEEIETERSDVQVLAVGVSGTEGEQKEFTWKELFLTKDLRVPLMIACMLQVMQQFSGINAVFFFSEGIFRDSGVPERNIAYAILGTNAINVLMTVVAIPIIEKAGRRMVLLVPSLVMTVVLVLLTISLSLSGNHAWLGYVSVVLVIVYVIGFAMGLGPIPMIITAEMFRQGPRPKAMSFAGIVNWICTFIIALTFEPIRVVLVQYTFIIFCLFLILFMLLSFKYVPETKGKTIEEIADQFSPGGNVTVAVDIIDPAAATEVDEGHLSAAAGDDNFTESSVDGIEMQEKAGEEQSMFF